MSQLYQKFLAWIPSEGKILDFGCGSGRDSNFFFQNGYQIRPIDGSIELCRLASEYIGTVALNVDFYDFDDESEYDGIWACASLLHIPYDKIQFIMRKFDKALKPNGVVYVSFKYGDYEGVRNSKYYTDMTESRFEKVYSDTGLVLINQWISEDTIKDRECLKWFNAILRKG